MLAGLLNKKLTLQEETITKNSIGQSSISWVNVRSKKVSIKFLSGGETDKDGIINYNNCELLMWYDKNLSYNNRFIDSFNQVYDIQSIQPIGLNEGLKIKCIVKENIKTN